MSKLCKTCGIEKHLDEFNKNSKTKDGLQGKCKECNKSYLKPRVIDNPEKLKHSYRNTNLDAKKEYNKRWSVVIILKIGSQIIESEKMHTLEDVETLVC